ncbi:MAG: beta-glucosidase [Anaerolineae bacterium]|nr:beta-glucosidase [Phycisphaerae bacterium]
MFPNGFVWGAAAAAYQIEGATREDGRGMCVWDMFGRKDGAIFSGHTGEIACDHYHRWRDDIQLMKEIGLHAYRLSICWPRVIPDGVGAANERGLAFYDQLIDGLLEAGITPFVTLFHWDYPYELYCRGGWLNHESPEWFAQYTKLIAQRLGDRVQHWVTLNEPQCFLQLGHRDGVQAPGVKLAWMDVLRGAHHSLLAHGRAVQMLREHCKIKPTIGWAPVGEVAYPATDSAKDVDAARARTYSAGKRDLWNNTLFSDPVCLGHYPDDALRAWGDDFPKVTQSDLDTIHQKLDFYGLNIYRGQPIHCNGNGKAEEVPREPGHAINAYHWPVAPQSLYWGPRFIYERYKLPIYITENGLSCLDWVSLDGAVHDPQRIDFTRRYLRELGRAVDQGVDVRGYFHWSLIDNFEWADGYRQRFGLIHVDYTTQQRTLKDSARWYSLMIRTNGREL